MSELIIKAADRKQFSTSLKIQAQTDLSRRAQYGVYSNKYRPVDYEKLKALASEKKQSGKISNIKIKKLQEFTKVGKEQNLLKQHIKTWHTEFQNLKRIRKSLEQDLEQFKFSSTEDEFIGDLFLDFEIYEDTLSEKNKHFCSSTIDPIWTLRDDLKFWLSENDRRPDMKKTPNNDLGDVHSIQTLVESVKQQQSGVLEKLTSEEKLLSSELHTTVLTKLLNPDPEKNVQTGIPEEAYDLECPDDQLKVDVIQEFISIDDRYIQKLNDLKIKHQDVLKLVNGGWSAEDHYQFKVIIDQYPADISNHRMLYIDRLMRQFPLKTRANIVAHEEWYTGWHYFHERQRAIISDWCRDRKELLVKTKVIFSEAVELANQNESRMKAAAQQLRVCDALVQQLNEWKAKKQEAFELEQLAAARQQEELFKKILSNNEREEKRRIRDKEKIRGYHDMLDEEARKVAEEQNKRLLVLQQELEAQARFDKERVEFREQKIVEKNNKRKLEEYQKLKEQKDNDELLERIREQVRPHVASDSERVMSHTAAWESRHNEDESSIQRPLYSVNTFTSEQVTSDPRVKLEQKLRDAGLQSNEYARKLISQARPPQPPRRDTESTAFQFVAGDNRP